MKDRIVVIDTFSCGSFHEMFNAEILKAYSYIFKNVYHYGISSSIDCIQKICVDCSNIQYTRLPLSVESNNRIGTMMRFFWSALYTTFFLSHFRKEHYVAINYNNPFLLPLLRLFGRFMKGNVYICCHGELELLAGLSGKNGLLALMQKKMLFSFFSRPVYKNVHFFVLGESIIENLNSIIPNNIEHFFSINHPYRFGIEQTVMSDFSQSNYRIGIIGLTNKNKGYDLLVRLVQNLDLTNNRLIDLWHIGKLCGDIVFMREKGVYVVERDENGNLSRNIYENLVSSLQFVLLLYPMDSYKLTASGAIFEAIANLKPVIALSNPFFEYVFSVMGKIGYLFHSMDELEQFLLTFHIEEQDYLQMQDTMLKNRNRFSAKAVSEELEKLIK